MGLVICFAGKIASGKSTLSEALSLKLNCSRVAFGDYVRSEVVKNGLDPEDRGTLQNFGQSLVDADPEGFCNDVLRFAHFSPGDNLIVDGIRHVAIYECLRRLVSPSIAKLIFLAAADQERMQRSQARRRDNGSLISADTHRVEAELNNSVPARADMTLDGSLAIDNLLSLTMERVQEWAQEVELQRG